MARPERRHTQTSSGPSNQRDAPSRALTPSLDHSRPSKRHRRNTEGNATAASVFSGSKKPKGVHGKEATFLPKPVRRTHLSMKNIWLKHLTGILGSEEKALATLQTNAPLPFFHTLKDFILAFGRWGTVTAEWSYILTKMNAGCVFDMLAHCQRRPIDAYRVSIDATIESLRKKAQSGDMAPIRGLPTITCYTTCYFCGLCIFNDTNASAHFEDCFANAVGKIFSKLKKQDFSPMGFESLSYTVSTAGYKTAHTFCPLCLFDTTLSWAQRMTPQPSPTAMLQHLVSHGQEEGEFRMDKRLYCGFFPWKDEKNNADANWFTVPDMFTHLHNDHGYSMLACTNPIHYLCSRPKTRDLRTEIRNLGTGGVANTIFYESDIRRIREHLGHDADEFGYICLMDECRTAEAMSMDLAAIDRMYEEQDPDR